MEEYECDEEFGMRQSICFFCCHYQFRTKWIIYLKRVSWYPWTLHLFV